MNHRYECIHILDFFLHPMPKGKIKPNVGSFITNMSLAATSCAIRETFYLAAETVLKTDSGETNYFGEINIV